MIEKKRKKIDTGKKTWKIVLVRPLASFLFQSFLVGHITPQDNVTRVTDRLGALAVSDGQFSLTDSLIRNATQASTLCQMPPTWHPWL